MLLLLKYNITKAVGKITQDQLVYYVMMIKTATFIM